MRAGLVEPAHGLALDEALVRVAPQAPAAAVWRSSPAVIVGRFQRVDWEIDPAACGQRGVRAWRRFTGGAGRGEQVGGGERDGIAGGERVGDGAAVGGAGHR